MERGAEARATPWRFFSKPTYFTYKQSLGIKSDAAAASSSDDPRKVVVISLAMEVAGRPDIVMDVSTPGACCFGRFKRPNEMFPFSFFLVPHLSAAVAKLQQAKPVVIKEGTTYTLKLTFKIQHEIVTGLKYLHVVKRMGLAVDKAEEMVGSYGPQVASYEKRFPPDEAPSGMMARGTYDVRSAFIDDDNVRHLEWTWVGFDLPRRYVNSDSSLTRDCLVC